LRLLPSIYVLPAVVCSNDLCGSCNATIADQPILNFQLLLGDLSTLNNIQATSEFMEIPNIIS
jgi:hypothetical protein